MELVLVLLIVAVLGAIAAPRYGASIARYRADMAARRIAADLALAQANARTTSSSRSVTFDATTHSYRLDGTADPDRPTQTYTVRLQDAPYHATLLPPTLGGDQRLVFNGFGVPDSAGAIVIQCGAVTRTVELDATTGSTTIR